MKMFEKILVPLDFSPSSEAALRVARDLARANQGALLLVHVHELLVSPDGELVVPSVPDAEPEFDLRLEAAKLNLVREGGVAVDARCLVGRAAVEIIALAKEESFDLIVMGTHGRTGLKHLLLGSVAEAVVRKASCPVLTLRERRPEARAPACSTTSSRG